MQLIGEVRCLACGRYLADAAEVAPYTIKLVPPTGSARPHVQLREGRPFCTRCGGRAFVEYDLGHRGVMTRAATLQPAGKAPSKPLGVAA